MDPGPALSLVQNPLVASRWRLDVGGVPQSFVDLDDPTDLVFGYVQAIGAILDQVPGSAYVHVGGGAMTVPRYLGVRRPGARHLVLEPDTVLTAEVLAVMPLPDALDLRIEATDGAAGIAACADASADVVVVDAAVGGEAPAELLAEPFLRDVRRVLRAGGVVIGNLPGGVECPASLPDAVGAVFAHRLLVGNEAVRRTGVGNLVYAASTRPLPLPRIADATAALGPPQRTSEE